MLGVPLAMTVLGLVGLWPYLLVENGRMNPWRIPLIWLSEVTAVFWYVKLLPGMVRGTLDCVPVTRLAWTTLLLGCSIDVAMTVGEMRGEHAAYDRSMVSGRSEAVHVATRSVRGARRLESLTCTFTDAENVRHPATFLRANTLFPPDVERKALRGDVPFGVSVRYDPECPGRYWLAETTHPHHNRIFWASFSAMTLGGVLGAICLEARRDLRWAIPTEIAPLLAVSIVFGVPGVLNLLFAL